MAALPSLWFPSWPSGWATSREEPLSLKQGSWALPPILLLSRESLWKLIQEMMRSRRKSCFGASFTDSPWDSLFISNFFTPSSQAAGHRTIWFSSILIWTFAIVILWYRSDLNSRKPWIGSSHLIKTFIRELCRPNALVKADETGLQRCRVIIKTFSDDFLLLEYNKSFVSVQMSSPFFRSKRENLILLLVPGQLKTLPGRIFLLSPPSCCFRMTSDLNCDSNRWFSLEE